MHRELPHPSTVLASTLLHSLLRQLLLEGYSISLMDLSMLFLLQLITLPLRFPSCSLLWATARVDDIGTAPWPPNSCWDHHQWEVLSRDWQEQEEGLGFHLICDKKPPPGCIPGSKVSKAETLCYTLASGFWYYFPLMSLQQLAVVYWIFLHWPSSEWTDLKLHYFDCACFFLGALYIICWWTSLPLFLSGQYYLGFLWKKKKSALPHRGIRSHRVVPKAVLLSLLWAFLITAEEQPYYQLSSICQEHWKEHWNNVLVRTSRLSCEGSWQTLEGNPTEQVQWMTKLRNFRMIFPQKMFSFLP